jgi:hypothetical protein
MKRRWTFWVVRIVLGLIAVFVLLCAVVFVRDPGGAMMVAYVLLEPVIANTHPPPIVNGVSGWRDEGQLTRMLQQKFPAGTTEGVVKATLLRQGFKPLTPPPEKCVSRGETAPVGRIVYPCLPYDLDKALEYNWSNFPCGDTIRIWWKIGDNGAITEIGGYHGSACL